MYELNLKKNRNDLVMLNELIIMVLWVRCRISQCLAGVPISAINQVES